MMLFVDNSLQYVAVTKNMFSLNHMLFRSKQRDPSRIDVLWSKMAKKSKYK